MFGTSFPRAQTPSPRPYLLTYASRVKVPGRESGFKMRGIIVHGELVRTLPHTSASHYYRSVCSVWLWSVQVYIRVYPVFSHSTSFIFNFSFLPEL